MDEERLNARFEELDTEIVGAQTMVKGANAAVAAVALALIDAGLIDRLRLIAIIESLRTHLQAASVIENIGDVSDAELPLDTLLAWIDDAEWRTGEVLNRLRLLESAEFLRLLNRKS